MSHRLEDLLAHADWLRRLAAHLVRGDAEDLLHDTWEAALRAPPDPGRPARPWLAEVLRNLVRGRGRRRRLHGAFLDQAGAGDAAVPSPEALVERAEVQCQVARLVMALEEPYRSTVLLRYYEGLSGAEIAAAQEVPPGTVRWRLKEGLDRIRARLDERHGRAWSVLLWPVSRPGALEGALLMAVKTKVGIVLGLLALALGGALVWRTQDPAPASRQASIPMPTARPRAVLEAWARAGRSGEIAGVVREPGGRGVAGSMVALIVAAAYDEMDDRTAFRPRASTPAGDGGAFRFPDVTPGIYLLTATAPGWSPGEAEVSLLPGEARVVELRLSRGGATLRGTVSDVGGGPVAGASVRALALGAGRRPEGARTFLATSDGAGRFAVELARGSYRVVADADGYVPASLELALQGEQARDFRLTPAARISGHAVERGGGPVPGARVRLESDAILKPASRLASAGDDGSFVFANVAPGSFRVTARAGNLVGSAPGRVTVALGGASDVVVELSRGLAIAGTVRSQSGPLAGARVRAGDVSVLSGAEGRYRMEGLTPGRHVVIAEAAGHAPAQAAAALTDVDATVDLTLDGEAVLAGRVVSRDGAPVAGASVTAFNVKADALAETVLGAAVGRSDGAGRFRLGGLAPGEVRVEAEHPAAGRGVAGPLVPAGELEVRLGRGGMVRGLVRWDDRTPAAGVVVGGNQRGRPGASTLTGAGGDYEIGPFPAGEVRVSATPEIDPLGVGSEVQRVTLAAGEDRDHVDLVLPRHDEQISGVVLAPDGTPLSGATVGASADYRGVSWRPYNKYARDEGGNYTELSSADGSFTIRHLPKGTFTVWATHPALPEADAFRVPSGTRGVRLAFSGAGSLSGRAVDRRGAPVAIYTLYALLSRSNDASPELRAARGYVQETEIVQHPAGAFAIHDLHPATYDLLATTPDGRGGRLAEIVLPPGSAKRELVVVVGDPVRVRGRVLDAAERPLAGVTIVGWLAMLKEQVQARSDGAGVFVLDGVVPGAIDLSLRGAPGSGLVANRMITVPDGVREHDAGTFALKAPAR